jgi:hypothetical protein
VRFLLHPRVIVILCVDADPDRPEHGGMRYDCPDRLTWEYLPKLVSKIGVLREDMSKRGASLRLTWFIRADLQIRAIYGDAGWSVRQFENMWRDVSEAGDELAWHPHAWRWSDSRKCWYNETRDTNYIIASYEAGFEAFTRVLGFPPAASRAGINFHNDHSIAKLDEMGIKTDLSGHSGLAQYYTKRKVGNPIREGFDWSRAPIEPYHPSTDDYQRNSGSDKALKILEIPITIWRRSPNQFDYWRNLLPVRIRGGMRSVRPALRGWFIPNVWGDPFRFELGLQEVLDRAKSREKAHYASYMHPDDVSDANYQNFAQNLEYMIRTAERSNIDLEFATASQAREILENA